MERVVEARFEAEARKANAEAQKFEAEAAVAEIALKERQREQEEVEAADRYNHVFNFSSQVSESSVKSCIDVLSVWNRMAPGCDIEIRLNSPGGDVIDGLALFDHILWIREQGHEVTMVVRGMAASMAGILLQAATHRVIGKEAWVLIHRAAFGMIGKTFEVEDRVEWIKRIEARFIDIFVARAAEAAENGTASQPLTKQKVKTNWERKDWWLSSEECIKYGVADEVR